ncbi:xylose isomerase [Spirochaeta isovalerica]|uniref:Xylose isomerase n=1 Tax=Spirochaeta isovalerica TaxID=150 RepID=A0A841RC81_9SPIO|nr:xylose isomerase [Spirochaeta isovalerica]MBB6481595.1 xylose isomerase [Spirochaeta isovalerica]
MSEIYKGNKEYFPGIGKIKFEGRGSDNPLAFKFYDENKVIAGKTMKEHLRFAVAYWHTFCADGSDPFGNGTIVHPWKNAEEKADAAFEFITKVGAPYYCFHDIDASPDADSVTEYEANYKKTTELLLERQKATGVKLLWNTANAFSHPRYMNGASTNPDFRILARAAAQIKASLDANVILGGENYVFWGGREGYTSLLNTNMKKELEHMAQFLTLARDYGRKIGFKGTFLIEPKPMEPSKHQYDVDSATVIGFLKEHGLEKDFKLNIEANHATLAGHSFDHELRVAADAGLLGSVDANIGDPQNGWDTDQFPTNVYDALKAMMVIMDNGGLGSGGLNFDAKVRRNSTDLEDLFHAHIGGMDTFALALEVTDKINQDGKLAAMLDKRYESFNTGKGLEFEQGKMTLEDLRDFAAADAPVPQISGKQEMIENMLNRYMFG